MRDTRAEVARESGKSECGSCDKPAEVKSLGRAPALDAHPARRPWLGTRDRRESEVLIPTFLARGSDAQAAAERHDLTLWSESVGANASPTESPRERTRIAVAREAKVPERKLRAGDGHASGALCFPSAGSTNAAGHPWRWCFRAERWVVPPSSQRVF